MATHVRIGCAGWPAPPAEDGLASGSRLERYARVLRATEINSSFHRPHRVQTYERWAASVPADFRFAVKMPKAITHEARLVRSAKLLHAFLGEIAGLGERLGPLLLQLPPSLEYDTAARRFLDLLRRHHQGAVACEPRHPSWFEPAPDEALRERRIARVAADPARVTAAAVPGGWDGLRYFRLHGSPVMYRSSYGPAYLEALAQTLRSGGEAWCIFDNTAGPHAWSNALDLQTHLA